MGNKEDAEEYRLAQAQKLLDLFAGAHGRKAKTIKELEAWVSSPAGKAALALRSHPGRKDHPLTDSGRRE
jgi:hypothetical protein